MDQRTRRSPARFLAPLALIAVVVVAMAIVTGNGNSDKGSAGAADTSSQAAPAKTSTSKTSASATGTGTTAKSQPRKSYTIKIGDTLGGIADKTGVTVEQLQELNPDVDPHAMTAGQKIRLR